ncbi:hypothetical protein [Bacillus sp. V3B]|uniref:hypothetical protein n=1 Tax=Bacillus sp. V3B TaxID=2804915 RepID=UPI0021087A01|nr:hypothetical protein [Bacillus sp. V3B]
MKDPILREAFQDWEQLSFDEETRLAYEIRLMESAIKLYERLGFERLPQFDFEPANDGIIVKAFRLTIK